MKTEKRDNYLLIENNEETLTQFSSEITKNHNELKEENLVIDLQKNSNLELSHLLGFLEISNLHRNTGKSFVIVTSKLGIDELPEELVVVPTLQEAEDMIQMDEIQRDLGF